MKTANRLNLLSMPQLREEIALGRQTRTATKVRMAIGYSKLIAKAVEDENFADAAINASKLAGILRAWEAKKKADTFACMKSSASEVAMPLLPKRA